MLVVARWLDGGRPDDGEVLLPVDAAVTELDLASGREGLLDLMAALGDLESRGVVQVAWPKGMGGRDAQITLAADVRRDARRLFGG